MTHGSPSFTIKFKTHKVKTLSQKIYSKNSQINSISKSQKQPLIAYDFYFPRNMIVSISESNPKIQCQYVLLKAFFYFLFFVFFKKNKQKTKLEKRKKKQNKQKTKSEKGENKFSSHTPHLIHALSSMYSIYNEKKKYKVYLPPQGGRYVGQVKFIPSIVLFTIS